MNYPHIHVVDVPEEDENHLIVNKDQLEDLLSSSLYCIRSGGNLQGVALFLEDDNHDWKLVKDSCGYLCLVAIKKAK